MITTAALLAGGLATRLYPQTHTLPKSLIDINGRPFISYQLELLKKNGIKKVVICAGYLGGLIEDFVKDGQEFGLEIEYSFDGEKLLGTGGALKMALPKLGETFFVMYGDSYLPIDFQAVGDFFKEQSGDALMTVVKNNNQWDKSNVVFQNGNIIRYDKNMSGSDMDYIDYGLEIIKSKCLDEMINDGQVVDLAEIFKNLVSNKKLLGYEVYERFYEIGSFSGIEETKKYLLI